MIPLELERRIINLPEADDHKMVIITGDSFRHKRFAYRLQKEFGDLVLAWYELSNDIPPKQPITEPQASKQSAKLAKLISPSKRLIPYLISNGVFKTLKVIKGRARRTLMLRRHYKNCLKAELKLFEAEVKELEVYSKLKPIRINPKDTASEEFKNQIRKYNPYFLLTLGGPLYKKPLLDSIRGVAVNQHSGHSPTFEGSHATEWALYHRNLNYVSNTVHIITTGADAGPILRRSDPCIFHKDNPATIIARVAALGAELMIEVVQEIINDKKVTVFERSDTAGKTYWGRHFDGDIITSITRDFDNNWLEDELIRQRKF